MISTSQPGVVVRARRRALSIRLSSGSLLKVDYNPVNLKIGDRVHVLFNQETDEVASIMAVNGAMHDPNEVEPVPWETLPPLEFHEDEEVELVENSRETGE